MSQPPHPKDPDTQLFRDIFHASPIGIAVENIDGQPLFVNPAFCAMLGFSEEELRSKHCVDFSPAEDAAKDWELFQQLRAGSIDHYQIEKRYFRRDGSLIWGRLSISLLNNGRSPLVIAMVQDITEKKKAEDAVFRHAAIVEFSNDAFIGLNPDATIATWNKGAELLFGYSAVEAIGKNVLFLSPEDARDDARSVLKKVWQGEVVQHHEVVRRRKDGTSIDISLTVSPIVDSQGRIIGASGVARDISERKRAEDAIRKSETRYRGIVETANEGVWLLDSQLRTLYVNPQMAEMLGYEPAEMVGRSVFEFYFPEDVEHKKQQLRQRQQGRRVQLDERLRRKDGSELWVQISATPMLKDDGGFDGAMAMMSNITERRRAEETLRHSEEKFRNVFREAGVGMVLVAPDGRFLAANKAFCDLMGYTEEELLTKTVEALTFPADWPAYAHLLQESLKSGRGFQWFEKRCLHKSGRIVYTESSASLIRSHAGVPQYFVGEVLDVTKRKEAEELMSGMTRKLIEAQEQERARIARELHDDINQRLAIVSIELHQLKGPKELRSKVQGIRNRLENISSDVQAISHDLHSSNLEYLGVVAAIKSWCRQFASRYKIEIDFEADVSSALPLEVALSLFRVLQEALHNALKHSGVKHINVGLAERENEVHLLVSDSGRGFDIEAVRQKGGLGLTSMRERVRLVNGDMQIQSKPTRGTTIRVRVPLPLQQTAAPAVAK